VLFIKATPIFSYHYTWDFFYEFTIDLLTFLNLKFGAIMAIGCSKRLNVIFPLITNLIENLFFPLFGDFFFVVHYTPLQ